MRKVSDVQRHLVRIWGIGFGFCFAVMFALTAVGTFEGGTQEAWGWFLPTMLPTLAVALTAAVAEEKGRARVVSLFVARLSTFASTLYVVMVVITLLCWPFTGKGPLQWFKTSGLWLGPIQGLIGAVLAVFLTRHKDA